MSRLSANVDTIELANTDTQLLFQDVEGGIEVYLEREQDRWTKDVAFGIFTEEEIEGLADLLYLRYSRKTPIDGTVVKYDGA